MKRRIAIALAAFAVAAWSTEAQSPSEGTLYGQLTTNEAPSSVSISALDRVLKTSDEFSAAILYTASSVAFREKRLDDAGFLLYIARFRARFDKALFPPTGTGGNSPLLALAALQQEVGAVVNPAIMAEPKTYAKVADRVRSWTPKVPSGYHPGWDYSAKGSEKQAEEATAANRKETIEHMTGLSQLLLDRSYFAAFKTVQDHNLKRAGETKGPSDEAYDVAVSTIQRIEKEKGITGVGTALKRSKK
jgi:hypothetical protein